MSKKSKKKQQELLVVFREGEIVLALSEQEARHLSAILHVAGFHEKRDLSESFQRNRTPLYTDISKVQKRLRKAIESISQDS